LDRTCFYHTFLFQDLIRSPGGAVVQQQQQLSGEVLVRQELLWQQRILEKDREIHEKEKKMQLLTSELNEQRLLAAQDAEAQRQMM
jgi:hypothetical protein